MISFVIVPVEGFFANHEGSFDCQGVFVASCSGGKVFVDVIHGWYDGGNAGHPSREEESRIFEDLR